MDVIRRIRGHSAPVRGLYAGARRVRSFVRDRDRRRLARCAEPVFEISHERGFVVLPPAQLPGIDAVVAHANETLRRYDPDLRPTGKNRKRFLLNVLDPATLDLDTAVMQFALRRDVLEAVSRYLGVVPLLTTIRVFHSDTTEGDLTSSQLHHCDGDDTTQIKIFVHCTDVDAASGPLTVIDAATSDDLRRRTGYHYRQRLTDEQVQAHAGGNAEHPITGPAGTAAFVDTSRCFHYGSRVAAGAPARLVTMIQYSTPYSFMLPVHYQEAMPFRRLIRPELPALQRLVLGE